MGYIGEFDQVILNAVETLPSFLHSFMVFITTIGSPVACVMILSVGIILAYTHKNKRLAFMQAGVLLAMPFAVILKDLTKRIRPDTPYVENMLLKTYSFPSGHAYASLITYGLLAFITWRFVRSSWRWPVTIGLIVLILLVGISRIYLGAHFPSDIIGGWILGAMILFFITRFGFQKSPDPKHAKTRRPR